MLLSATALSSAQPLGAHNSNRLRQLQHLPSQKSACFFSYAKIFDRKGYSKCTNVAIGNGAEDRILSKYLLAFIAQRCWVFAAGSRMLGTTRGKVLWCKAVTLWVLQNPELFALGQLLSLALPQVWSCHFGGGGVCVDALKLMDSCTKPRNIFPWCNYSTG